MNRESLNQKRRVRWPWILLVIILLLAALAVAAELVTRAVLPGIARGIVIEQLALPADQQLDVEASGVLLPQVIGGRLDELHLSTDSVTIGGITGSADVTAIGVPLRGGDLTDASGTVRIDQEQFTHLVAASDLPVDEIRFSEPDITASGSFSIFGVPVPISATVTPAADAGELLLTPVGAQIGGATLNAAEIVDRFGKAAAWITEPQRICIADQLPAGLTMTGLKIDGPEAVIDIDVDGAIVTDPALQQNGVCS
ncbi:LmeA family phospholipid-binding protein [Microbacterium sp. A204]|uniref:LmeA family phospholipid-binding protein n=1 Tax=Microbacterium sp. A204 TaxID=3457321 RepID=UPI003FD66D1F